MPGRNPGYLADRLSAGPVVVGQVRVEPGFVLNHQDEAGRPDLKVFHDPHDAILIARYDDLGRYRPLKTAPNLAHGWQLRLQSLEETLLALDFLYPAGVGTAASQASGELRAVSLRETLGRQSGMYAVARKLSGEQAGVIVRDFCRRGCLRRILWEVDSQSAPLAATPPSAGSIPLLCAEACNLFVAEARKAVKGAGAQAP